MKAGECALRLQDADLALRLFTGAARLTDRPDALYKAGEAKLLERDEAAAHELFMQALERDPYDYVSLYRAGLIEFNQGRLEEAQKHAEASHSSFPELRANVELLLKLAARRGDARMAGRYQAEANALHDREAELVLKKEN
jgi:tetratricopeptide (TPR) repeat protein